MNISCSNNSMPRWTLPPVFQHHDNSEQEVDQYIPLKDFKFFDVPILANKRFGDYFLYLINKRWAPICEVAAWMHLTGEQIVKIFEGKAPAPNTEQLAVAFVLLSLNEEEINKLTSAAVISWCASGIDVQEQLHPSRTIFRTSQSKTITEETKADYSNDCQMQEQKQAGVRKEVPVKETTAMPLNTSATDGQTKGKQKGTQVIIPPNLRMKVDVFTSELADGVIIEEITTKTGDVISIDKTYGVERDYDNGFIHYKCCHGKHRIDLFREDDTWYMDAMPLAAADMYSTAMVM